LGIAEDQCVFLYCGRLSPEKNPIQLLEAYHQVKSPRKSLVIVGDGSLRQPMQEFAAANNVESLHFLGFQDRNSIPKFYAMADALVLPSQKETWGMVVNEAMCFSLPVIVSDQVGAARDLVTDGYNGFEFPEGDLNGLTASLNRFLDTSQQEKVEMGARSLEIIKSWNKRDLASVLVQFSDQLYSVSNNQGNSRSRKKVATRN
jgi:glycosyltransferase involved in cell wall biosynthesis